MRETFGKYTLERRLAFGGMAEVFLGSMHGEAGFEKPVVIKRLHPRLNEDSEFVQMLIDEARITSQLSHSNICQVLDLGSVDDAYYIAMEFIAGEDLRTLQDHYSRNGEFVPVEAALYITAETLAGLDYAHAKEGPDGQPLGVVHRDVSPQNVLISYEGEVKVIDFGIAKAASRLVQTQAGVIKGKFRYMSPEQASGAPLDHRTDVFAAGVVLYELLRGGPHSQDVPDTEVLRRMREAEFEPIRRDRSDVPDALLRIVARALARKQRKRFGNAAEFRQAILRYLQSTGSTFGRTELAALMKTVFTLERRRERSGHSTKQRLAADSARASAAQRDPQRDLSLPRERAISGEIDRRGGLEYARTSAVGGAPPPRGLPRAPTEQLDSADLGARLPARPDPRSDPRPDARTEAQTVAHSTNRRLAAAPPAQGTEQLELDDVDVVDETDARDYERTAARDPLDHQRTRAREARDPRDEEPTRALPAPAPRAPAPAPAAPSGEAPERRRPRVVAGAFTRAAKIDGEADHPSSQPRGQGDTDRARAEPSRTEHVRRSGSGGGAGKTIALLLVLSAFAAGAFYLGSTYFGGKRGATVTPDAAFAARRVDAGRPPPDHGRPRAVPRSTPGLLQVSSKPAGAEIWLCGKRTGQVTPAALPLRPKRRCTLELKLDGYAIHRQSVRGRGRKPLTVHAVLMAKAGQPGLETPRTPKMPKTPRVDAAQAKTGELVITSIQVGQVRVNGRTMGQTPLLELNLAPGRYSVAVSFPTLGVAAAPRRVTIRAGQRVKLHFDPDP